MNRALVALMVMWQMMNVSAYTLHENPGGITASGTVPVAGQTVASNSFDFGTRVIIDGHEYVVEDRMAECYTNNIDIFMEDLDDAFNFGRRNMWIGVVMND